MAIQKLRELLWADGVVIPRDSAGHEIVGRGGVPPAQTATVVHGGGGFTTSAFSTFGLSWVCIADVAAGGSGLGTLAVQGSDDGVNWTNIQGPFNTAGSVTTAIAPGSLVFVPVRAEVFIRLTGTSDPAVDQPLLVTVGDGPVFLPFDPTTTGLISVVYGAKSAAPPVGIPADAGNTDGGLSSSTQNALRVAARQYAFNGSTTAGFDRWRNNNSISTFAGNLQSAARTATTTGTLFTNFNWTKIMLVLNVTVASGTGGLQTQLLSQDLVSGATYALNAAPAAVVAPGTFVYAFFPGASSAGGGITNVYNVPLPRQLQVQVTAGDATSYTYSVSVEGLV